MNEGKGLIRVATALTVLAVLLIAATVVCALLACWVVGDNAARWGNTAFIGFLCSLLTGGAAAIAWTGTV